MKKQRIIRWSIFLGTVITFIGAIAGHYIYAEEAKKEEEAEKATLQTKEDYQISEGEVYVYGASDKKYSNTAEKNAITQAIEAVLKSDKTEAIIVVGEGTYDGGIEIDCKKDKPIKLSIVSDDSFEKVKDSDADSCIPKTTTEVDGESVTTYTYKSTSSGKAVVLGGIQTKNVSLTLAGIHLGNTLKESIDDLGSQDIDVTGGEGFTYYGTELADKVNVSLTHVGNKITMEKCYAALTVDGESAAGGLIGLVYKADVTLINCYADSYVFGPFAGGLVGYIDGVSDNKGTVEIQSCYAAGYLYGTVTTVIKQETGCRQGGLIAEKKTNAIISIEKKSYTVCEFMGVGSKITTIPGGNINLYYLNNGDESHINGTVYKGEVLEGGFDAGKQAANAYNLLSQYEKYPNEPKYYEYPGIKGLPHYGDWGPLSKGELKVSVVNGEKLVAYVTVSGIKSPVVTYKFTGLSSNKVKTITMSGITSSAIIDSLESSSTRFKSQFAGFYPGEYVKLEVSANEGKLTAAAISFNSLYYDDNGKVATSSAVGTYYSDNDRYAVITCGRHLQNLDASAQDSNKLFTRAMVKKNISFGQGSDWAKAYSSLTFSAITNNSLVAFNGGNKTITDLKVNTSGNAGLFKNIGNSSKNVTITAITMVRPNIKGTGNVGVIAGETNTSSAGITITSCAAIDAVVSTSGEYAGGLIGRNNANTTISNCSNRLNTLASNSSFKSSIDSNGASSQPNVFGKLASGGLVGITADSCDLAIKNSFAAVVVGGSDCENSGGLIGKTGVSAPNNNPSTGETVTTPVDFVLVLDQSGSMAYDYSNSSTTKQQALKNSATSFINLAAKQDCIDGSTHRVAIVGFESDAWNISNGLTDLTTSGANTLVNKVNALPKSPSGGTHMDEGLQLAIDILKNRTETTYTLEDGSKLARKTVVVFFTDGYPGDQQASGDYFTSYYDTDQFADAAVAKASVLKGMGATIFCVGAFDGANPSTAYTTTLGQETARGWFSSGTYKTWTTAAKSANGLMHFISSDYDATCTSWTGFTTSNAGTNKGYYMSANDPDALLTALNMILEKVTPQIPVVTSNHVAGISNSYADCYTTANHYASGLIGLVNGIPASVNNSYASGYTNIAGNKSYTSKVQAGLAACAASDYISISNSYTIIKPSTTTNFCSTVNENPKAYNNLYYKIVGDLSLYGYRIQSSAASDLGDAFVDASTVTPYNLRNQGLSSTAYPAPVLSGIHHYGDWHPYPNTTAKVTVTVSNSNVLTSTISLEVSGAETNEVSVNYTVSQNGNAESYQKTCVVSLDSSGKGSTTITLDDLSSSEKHFNSLFPKLTAGANCTITVTSVSDCSFASSGNTLAKNFNSLYAENTSGSNVHISCARHLQNLDVKTSKVALTGITAILDSDVVASGVVEVNPIQNENLVVFNGNNHTITDLKLASNNMVGLFASVGSLTNQTTEYIVQNLKLSGPVIDCTLQDSAAGAIAGKTYGNVLIQNCYVTDAKVVASNNGNAGGLVGINDGSLRISNCGVYYAGQKPSVSNGSSSGNRVYGGSASGGLVGYTPSNSVIWISNSFAAVVVGDISTTNYAGGLIGKSDARNSWSGSGVTVTGTQINNSYADCYVSGKYSCGFVGHMSPDTSSNLKVFDCYVSGFLYTKYKASKGGVMSGITYIDDKVNVEVRHFYNVCGYNGNWEYTAYSATNKYGGEYSNVYYISRDGNYTYPRHGDQKSLNDIKGLTSKLGSSFTTNSPYANGSYPGLNGVPHYSYN